MANDPTPAPGAHGVQTSHDPGVARADEFGPPSPERRRFLSRLSIGLSGAIGVIIGIPFISFLLAPLLRRPAEEWRPVRLAREDGNGEPARVGDFRVGETVQVNVEDPSPLPWAGIASQTAMWLRRDSEQEFKAFAVNCTHLGCPVRWMHDAGLFLCPCHGGVFYKDGTPAGGPPPRPLAQYQVRVRDGWVEVLAGASPLA